MARVMAILMAGFLLGAVGVAAPASASDLVSRAAPAGPPPACLTVGLFPPYVGVDPLYCWSIVVGIMCFVLYKIAPYIICRDPLGIIEEP